MLKTAERRAEGFVGRLHGGEGSCMSIGWSHSAIARELGGEEFNKEGLHRRVIKWQKWKNGMMASSY